MQRYDAPVRDMQFVLYEVFNTERQWSELGLDEVNRELADAVLEEGAKICQTLIAPLNLPGHEAGVQWHEDEVSTPAGFKDAYRALAEDGWGAPSSCM